VGGGGLSGSGGGYSSSAHRSFVTPSATLFGSIGATSSSSSSSSSIRKSTLPPLSNKHESSAETGKRKAPTQVLVAPPPAPAVRKKWDCKRCGKTNKYNAEECENCLLVRPSHPLLEQHVSSEPPPVAMATLPSATSVRGRLKKKSHSISPPPSLLAARPPPLPLSPARGEIANKALSPHDSQKKTVNE